MLYKHDPAAASLLLGHSTVTTRHYVNSDDILRRALEQLPQPDAFTEGPRQRGADPRTAEHESTEAAA